MAKQKDTPTMLREPAEMKFAAQLEALRAADTDPKPPGWHLSPRAVRTFILGNAGQQSRAPATGKISKSAKISAGGDGQLATIPRKFHGEEAMIDRAIVTLMSNRGLLLVGEPGTAKSMLSELLTAAISGSSALTIQGTAGTTEDQIKYSWNYALLLAEGPTPNALVPAPLYHGLSRGQIVRFEEITRCPPEIQDTLISVLSDKVLHVPELKGADNLLFAKPGFNVIATANTRDRGVHEMSAALKRRFNFETVPPIAEKRFELELVLEQANDLLQNAGAVAALPPDVIDVLVTTFMDLRKGRTEEGTVVEKPSTAMSTAEAVSVAFAAGLEACYLGDGQLRGENLAKQLVGTVLKDSAEDAKKVCQYFDVVVKNRAKRSEHWKSFYDGRGILGS
ncbi:MAG TPA: AAA family ATPase [Gemmataceae bacterium]|nr:AAA family ATPase [Gemmataceae bacterium]